MDLILLSGGIESTTLLYERRAAGAVQALFVDYGQRAAARERATVQALCAKTGTALTIAPLQHLRAALTDRSTWQPHIPAPARNLLIISLAANYALVAGGTQIFLGVQRDDRRHREAGGDFLAALAATLATFGLGLATPYQDLSKTAVIARGLALGVDYDETYSCLLGRPRPCGQCPQCAARNEALAALARPPPP